MKMRNEEKELTLNIILVDEAMCRSKNKDIHRLNAKKIWA